MRRSKNVRGLGIRTFNYLFVGILLCLVANSGCSNESNSDRIAEDSVESAVQPKETEESDSLVKSVVPLPQEPISSQPYLDTGSDRLNQFVELSPFETGMDLMHIWAPPAKHRNLVNPVFGAGVAIGDFDNDGWQDVFVARQNDTGRLFRNLGGMKFADVTQDVGLATDGFWASGTTFVDINNDGWLDLYICGFDCSNRLYINNKGRFSERAAEFGLDFCGASIEMTFADYDRDGDLDGYLVTNFMKPEDDSVKLRVIRKPGQAPRVADEFRELFYFVKNPDGGYRRMRGGQFDHFYRNDGGKFVEVTEESGIGWQPHMGLSANWWDYNSDGWPDLYVANDFAGPDFLYRNNGPNEDGVVTFSNVDADAFPHTPWYSMGSDFADINNDGRIDYLGSDMAGTNHYRDKLSMGNMSGPNSTAWFLNFPDPPQYMRNAMYLNTGTERFMEIAFLAGLSKTDWTWTVKFADLDNDGWQDVFFTNGMTRDLVNSDLLSQLRKIEKEFQESGDTSKTLNDVAQEFWESQEPFRLENLAFKNTGDLKFKDVSSKWGLDHLGVSTAAAMGDLDNDGDIDIVVNGFEEPLRLYQNDVAGQNSIRFKLIGRNSNRQALGAMVRIRLGDENQQVRYLSSSRGFMSTSEPVLHFGTGDFNSVQKISIEWPSGITQELEDLACNQTYTIIESDAGVSVATGAESGASPLFERSQQFLNIRHEELTYDDFERQPLLPNKYSQLGPGMAWGDIDGDGDNDLFVGGAAFSSGQLILNQGEGIFEVSKIDVFAKHSKSEDMAPLFFDADGDSDLDLYVVSGGVECEPGDEVLQDRLYFNDGTGNFELSDGLPDMKFSGGCVVASDYDRDGDLDLFVGGRIVPGEYPTSPRSVLLENEGGRFKDVTELVDGLKECGMVTSAMWSDVDGDDWPELLATIEWGPVKLFMNSKGQLAEQTEAAGLESRVGWYNSICAGDIDNDGDTDFFVGNFGLNTKYKANDQTPAVMYYGDFEGTGRRRIVEAKFEDGVCLPRRGLSCSSHAMPMVKEKLPTFHEFALADLSEIYTEDRLSESLKLSANNLESGFLINESNPDSPRFRFEPLPRIAQASPIFGCSLNDVNGDGNLDLYVVQNFYGPQRETGYMDGGVSLLLTGNGKGRFAPVMPSESGLVVAGDATSLTAIDLNEDGNVDFVVGKNDAVLEVFLNQSPASKKASELHEMVRNLSEGTKVYIRLPNGSTRLHEITLGGGYLSQSPKMIFGDLEIEKVEVRSSNTSLRN